MSNPDIKKSLAITMLGASLFVSGCGSGHNSELEGQLPGNWKQRLPSSTINLTIYPEGAFSYSTLGTNRESAFTNMGTWRVKGGRIVLTATNKIGDSALPLGELFNAKIVKVDYQHLEYKRNRARMERLNVNWRGAILNRLH